MVMMIAFITFNSSLVPLIEGLRSSNPWEFDLSGFIPSTQFIYSRFWYAFSLFLRKFHSVKPFNGNYCEPSPVRWEKDGISDVYIYLCIYVCVYILIYMDMYICTYKCIYGYVYMYIYMYIYIYMYMHKSARLARARTHTHTHTHANIR